MKLYQKFRNSSLDTTDVGIYTGPDHSEYVFTPAGARIVAWAGVDGIHFCQVEGFGDMVFAVDPTAPPGDCVHPVANRLIDLIALVVACKDASLVFQAYQWSRAKFSREMEAIRPTGKMRSILRALQNTYEPPKIADPYGYITAIQRDFDYSALPLHPDYYEWCPIRPGKPKWEVGFGVGFFDYCEKGKAGQELIVKKHIDWNGEIWHIPAVYLCDDGIVVDSYLEVSSEEMARFTDKWGSYNPGELSAEDEMLRKLEDPLGMELTPTLNVNDKDTPRRRSFSLCWVPQADNRWNARRVLEHYGIDKEKGYLFRRDCFLRKGKNPPIRTMELTLRADPISFPGMRFVAPKKGESMTFTHPVTGISHSLTVLSQTREALDPNFLSNHPCCFTRLSYTLEPEIPDENIRIVDSQPADPVRSVDTEGVYHGVLIGGADGPTAVFYTNKTPAVGHCAMSSPRYAPADQITWRMIFKEKPRQDVKVPILP